MSKNPLIKDYSSLKFIAIIIIIAMACDRSEPFSNAIIDKIDYIDPEVIRTSVDRSKAEKAIQVTKALRKIYRNPMVVEEVNAAIATGYYEDETIALKDLLTPESSPVYQLQSFRNRVKSRGFEPGLFKKEFERELNIKSNPSSKTSDLYFYDDGLSIYFPYHEDTQYNPYPITVVAATVDTDAANAQHPLCDDLNPTTYSYCSQTVLVNDNYASTNPTHIVNSNATVNTSNSNSAVCDGPFKLHVGYFKFLRGRQYDKLISWVDGGGSEMRFFVARTTQSNTTTNVIWGLEVEAYATRKKIKQGGWISVWLPVFNSAWPVNTTNVAFGIYEEDFHNSPTIYFTGNLNAKDNNGYSFTNIYSIGVSSKNSIISNNVRERSWFVTQFNTLGNSPPFIQGYEPQFNSDDGAIVTSYPISCFQ